MVSSSNRRLRPWLGSVAKWGVKKAAKHVFRRVMSGGRSKTGRERSDNPLTNDRDYKTDYRKRRMGRAGRRRMRRRLRFYKRVEYANLRNTIVPSKVNREFLFIRQSIAGFSTQFHAMMHTCDGAFSGPAGSYNVLNPSADWREFFREGAAQYANAWDNAVNITTSGTNPAFPPVGYRYRTIKSHGCVMEVIVRNTGSTTCVVNAYRVVCKRDCQSGFLNPIQLYDEGFVRAGNVSEEPLTGANPWDLHLSGANVSATPFQSGLFCRFFTVLRRTKYELAPGQFFSLVVKDTKLRNMNMHKAIVKLALKGWTEGYFFDFNGVPTNNAGTAEIPSSEVTVSIWRRYKLSFMTQKMEQTALDTTDP